MKRVLLGAVVLAGVGVAVAFSGNAGGPGKTVFVKEDRNPVTHLRWNDDPQEFRFAIVSDRTGGHRANVFAQAVEKLNLLQPEFVVSVGDLIEGSKKDIELTARWKEFDSFVTRLEMPFFYAAGNHDLDSAEQTKFWEKKLGRRHYHFVYRNVLFLMLNSEEPPDFAGSIGKEQAAYAARTLADNAGVRWTIAIVHRPLWTSNNGDKNGWHAIEQALKGRQYTVFAGHLHRYQKYVRQNMNYYQLATTGGASRIRGVEQGEFDQIAWVTMKKEGPLLANILLDAVQTENLKPIPTNEPGTASNLKPTHPVFGKAFFEGVPIPGAQVTLTNAKGSKGVTAIGVVAADGSFRLSTYQGDDGAVQGDYHVTVVWRRPGAATNLLPGRYASAEKSGLAVTVRAGDNQLVLELRN